MANAANHLVQRPIPPPDLTDLQRIQWMQIANALPVDWFGDENRALLGAYVRTLATLANLDQKVDEFETSGEINDVYIELLKRREAQARLAVLQATKMRLTQQSRYRAEVAAGKTSHPRPKSRIWE